jgi:hypothetical protein
MVGSKKPLSEFVSGYSTISLDPGFCESGYETPSCEI